VKCPRCQHENPAPSKFCSECGTRLIPLAGEAATQPRFVSPDAYTPGYLAEKIITSRSALEGERKQVTVLFADIKGSMELLADRDPEEARELLDPVLDLMMEAVHRYEGTVNQVMGDGIMALFGAPLAHEDHAVRGCYAALRMHDAVRRYAQEIRRTHGLELQIRVGLNSGEVVVRSIGNDLRMDYTAVGQTTHLAGRMEQLATPGTTRITANVLNMAEGYVAVSSLGPMPVKGLAEPIQDFELVGMSGARTKLQVAARRGLSHFVGRNDELDHLASALEKAARGHGQVVAVIGEPGVGKSRLFYEFLHSHRTRDWFVLPSSSVSYGKATSYLPVIDMLKHYFRIHDRDESREIREKVTGKLLALDEALRPLMPALLALLDVAVDDQGWQALDPPQRRRDTLHAINRLLFRESQVQPLCLVFEDLHWIDSETQAVLDGLVESLPTARILLLVNFRPEYRHNWESRKYFRQVRIDPLRDESANSLLSTMLGDDASLESLKSMLISRTSGNPLFIEESVRTLIETRVLAGSPGEYRLAQPVSTIVVPATVQAILAARIDRLPPVEKRLLQSAAVIGKDVLYALLLATADLPEAALREHLAHLQSAELLYEINLFPDLEYTFKHALTHEVAYSNVLHERRRELHRRIMEVIEALYADRLLEQTERLAHHALRGEQWEKAATYARKAGAKAAARSAHREAVGAFEQALAALEHLPLTPERMATAIDLRFDLRNSLHPLGELSQVLDHLRQALTLAEQLGEQRRLGWVASYMSQYFRLMGAPDQAVEWGERALAIARRLEDFGLETATNSHLGPSYRSMGQYRRAAEILRGSIEALNREQELERFGLVGLPAVISRTNLVWALAELGDFAEAASCAAESVRIAEAADDSYSLIFAYLGPGVLALIKGDLLQATNVLERAVGLCRTWTVPVLAPVAASLLGAAYVLAGRSSEALPLLEEAVDLATSMSLRATQGMLLTRLAEGYLLAGKWQDAQRLAPRALELSTELKERGNEAYAMCLLGDVAAQSPHRDPAQAKEFYTKAGALARGLEMRPLVAHCHLRLGKLHRRLGPASEATAQLTTAAAMFRELDMALWRERTEIILSGSA
jgi:class 3 adenylate cyclase/tetratricopeptide (TPR) repeat protein